MKFLAVLEFQRNGRAHLHILIDRYIADDWIRQEWQAVGGGKIIDIRLVDVHRIAHYLSYYLTKEMMDSCPPRRRRITTSQDIRLLDPHTPTGWKWFRTSLWVFYEYGSSLILTEEGDEQGCTYFEASFDPLELFDLLPCPI